MSGENVVEKTEVVENDHGHSHLPDFVETVDVTDESTKLPVDETEKIQKGNVYHISYDCLNKKCVDWVIEIGICKNNKERIEGLLYEEWKKWDITNC